ncbi:MAG: hypothetical protein BGN86_01245 [Caulobacterales bacterium 68-7]|nr:hypothetical protein [Caulobacterales bacterium]OJU08099.1 MAG: hypothetical protein BGN86_01245 [Caulobacterales bacterium 68-7]
MDAVNKEPELLAVKTYCFDMLRQIADLLQRQGGEPEVAAILKAVLAARHGLKAEHSGASAVPSEARITPEPLSFHEG